jgi:hypothetical protein
MYIEFLGVQLLYGAPHNGKSSPYLNNSDFVCATITYTHSCTYMFEAGSCRFDHTDRNCFYNSENLQLSIKFTAVSKFLKLSNVEKLNCGRFYTVSVQCKSFPNCISHSVKESLHTNQQHNANLIRFFFNVKDGISVFQCQGVG